MIKTILVCFAIFGGVLLGSCAAAGSGQVNPAPAPVSTPVFQNAENDGFKKTRISGGSEQFAAEKSKALDVFVNQNFQGWKINGVASGAESGVCQEGSPCDLQLVNNNQTKIVTVIVKRFFKPDNSFYWLVYEARPIDVVTDKTGLADDEK